VTHPILAEVPVASSGRLDSLIRLNFSPVLAPNLYPHLVVACFRHSSVRSVSHLTAFAIVLRLFRLSRSGRFVASRPFWSSPASSPPRAYCEENGKCEARCQLLIAVWMTPIRSRVPFCPCRSSSSDRLWMVEIRRWLDRGSHVVWR
jgi:hypothetical protein